MHLRADTEAGGNDPQLQVCPPRTTPTIVCPPLLGPHIIWTRQDSVRPHSLVSMAFPHPPTPC